MNIRLHRKILKWTWYSLSGNHMLVGGWTLSQNGISKTLTRASDCTTLSHWHCDSSEVSKSSTENPFYWQMWPHQEDLAGCNWWRCSEHTGWSKEEELLDTRKWRERETKTAGWKDIELEFQRSANHQTKWRKKYVWWGGEELGGGVG